MMDLFDCGKQPLKIDKPIRLIELFSGVGAQAKALERLGADFEHYRTSEWEWNAVASYKAIHKGDDNTDYSEPYTKDELTDKLFALGISADGKKPMTRAQIARKNEKWHRDVYNSFKATNNVGSIVNASAEDLGIVDTDKYTYICCYSFPCTDLSLAGKQKGMAKGSNTSSSMLWQVERLLNECDELPQILLMENVTQVHGKGNKEHFDEWIAFLESKGYSNFWKDLNAKNFGIPQNRNRTFMVSILGDYTYEFPKEFPLQLRLKDMLEDSVDEKYYISSERVESIISSTFAQEKTRIQTTDVCGTLLARDYKDPKCVEVEPIRIGGLYDDEKGKHQAGAIWDKETIAPTVDTMQGGNRQPLIVDEPYIYQAPHGYMNGNTQKNCPSITTSSWEHNNFLVEPQINVVGNYSPSGHDASRIVATDGLAPTVKENHGTVTAIAEPLAYDEQNGYVRQDGTVGTLTTDGSSPKYNNRVIVFANNKKGYDEAFEGDSINLEQPGSQTRRGRVGHGVAQTLNTAPQQAVVESCYVSEKGVRFICSPKRGMATDVNADVCQPLTAKGQANWTGSFVSPDIESLEKSSTIGSTEPTKIHLKNGETVYFDGVDFSKEEPSVVGGIGEKKSNGGRQWYLQDRVYDSNIAISVTTAFNPFYAVDGAEIIREEPLEREGWHGYAKEVLSAQGVCRTLSTQSNNLATKVKEPCTLRIRKLTPKECWRLMGFDDADFNRAAQHNSNSQLYKQAGNSIVVDVLYYIFGMML